MFIQRSFREGELLRLSPFRRLGVAHAFVGGALLRLCGDESSLVERSLGSGEFLGQLPMPSRFARLPFERIQIPRDFGERVVDAQQIGLRLFQFQFRRAPFGLVLRDSRCLLDQTAAVLWLVGKDQVNLPLLHHRVVANPQAGIHEDVRDVLHADAPAVETELRLARAKHTAVQRDPTVVGGGMAVVRLQRERDFAHRKRPAAR